jgi:hypothetical protein
MDYFRLDWIALAHGMLHDDGAPLLLFFFIVPYSQFFQPVIPLSIWKDVYILFVCSSVGLLF